MERQRKMHIVAVILAVLLGAGLLALVGTFAYSRIVNTATAIAADNLIAPGGGYSSAPDERTANTDSQVNSSAAHTSQLSCAKAIEAASGNAIPASSHNSIYRTSYSATTASTASAADDSEQPSSIELYAGQPQENTPFKVGNMLPGDSEAKSFRVRVSHNGAVAVYCAASARPGYEKLAEVMRVRIELPATGEILYDGLLRDASDVPACQLASAGRDATDELQYKITAYLDTSVGNDYQNLDLVADIDWWVDDSGSLTPPAGGLPASVAQALAKTGDLVPVFTAVIFAAFAALLALLAISRKRRGGGHRG